MRPLDSFHILLSTGSGRVGVALLACLLAVSVVVVLFYPLDFGLRFWNNPAVWADNPKAVPPSWTGLLNDSIPRHQIFQSEEPTSILADGDTETRFHTFSFDYQAGQPPTFLSASISGVTYHSRSPLIYFSLKRPDGREVTLLRHTVRGPRPGEFLPVKRYEETPQRTFLSGDSATLSAVADFVGREFDLLVPPREVQGRVEEILFGTPGVDGFDPLRGTYTITISVLVYHPADVIGELKAVVGGAVYGAMGTDSQGRDLATGLLFGFPVALLIGVITAVGATTIGTFFGILSGFMGGRTDMVIQRISDTLTNIPLLPILIFLIFMLGQQLWMVVVFLVVFGWPGLAITVRSMVLQMRSGQLVEATQSLGASRWRIMFRHIFFQIAPFIIAQMIFFTPAAILAEAGLSFLGLGDPSIPTWGQILQQGFSTGAVYVGYWWWVLPPGFLIVLTGMTFVLLTLGIEPVVNPRLREGR